MFILWFYFVGKGRSLVVCDSIPKYCQINRGDVYPFPGATIERLTDRIAFGKWVDVRGYARIIVHVGANDLSDMVTANQSKPVTVFDMMAGYKELRNTIREKNPRALIIFSSVLPRYEQYDLFKPYAQGLNYALEKIRFFLNACQCLTLSEC